MKIGNREFDFANHTYVMGILNVTPDSFSDGGKYNALDRALFHAGEMVEEGASILDVGGESTRPGHVPVSAEEEMERVLPVVEALRKEFDLPISVDTYKAQVAAEAVKAGADLINDIWGLKAEPDMARVTAQTGVACCLMHNRDNTQYVSFMEDLKADLWETLSLAKAAGISDDKIILDPGVGFGKTYEQNLLAISGMGQLHEFGYPILLGTSRKSVIGLTLDLPVTERVEGTLVTTVLAVQNQVGLVRVHDVKENVRTIKMMEAIKNAK